MRTVKYHNIIYTYELHMAEIGGSQVKGTHITFPYKKTIKEKHVVSSIFYASGQIIIFHHRFPK